MNQTQLAALLGVTTRTIRRWVQEGDIPAPAITGTDEGLRWTTDQATEILAWHRQRKGV